MKLFVLDPHPTHRRGLAARLQLIDGVDAVGDAGSVREAWETPELLEAELVILDRAVPGGGEFIGALATMRAAAGANGNGNGNGHPKRPELTEREQQVLALIAAGHPTREVAQQLSYSERTVKGVLHDVAAKLNARSRSHAVACAVREGLI